MAFLNLEKKYWWALGFTLVIEFLGWLMLVLIVSPTKDDSEDSRFSIDKYEWLALLVSMTTGILGWAQLVTVFSTK